MKFKHILLIFLCIPFVLSGCSQSGYEDIVCEEYTKFQRTYFSEAEKCDIISMNLPKNWNYKKNDNAYDIVESSKIIGSVEFIDGNKYKNKGKQLFVEESETAAANVTHTINRTGFGRKAEYTHTFIYEYKDSYEDTKIVVLNVSYEKVDKNTTSKLMNNVKVNGIHFDDCTGKLLIDDNRGRILLLGNSFIGSSCIESTLQKMCGSSVTVEAHSRGNARVNTYAQDPYIMSDIRNGMYSAVFMCGFYNFEDASYFQTVVNACESSNTKLAIFPAHNEQRPVIDNACSTYSYPVLIDWKNEIDLLIESGINRSLFCVNDYHSHSTALAGYVGAHMAYRALFGMMPDENLRYEYVSSYQIGLLDDYETTARIYPSVKKPIYLFK